MRSRAARRASRRPRCSSPPGARRLGRALRLLPGGRRRRRRVRTIRRPAWSGSARPPRRHLCRATPDRPRRPRASRVVVRATGSPGCSTRCSRASTGTRGPTYETLSDTGGLRRAGRLRPSGGDDPHHGRRASRTSWRAPAISGSRCSSRTSPATWGRTRRRPLYLPLAWLAQEGAPHPSLRHQAAEGRPPRARPRRGGLAVAAPHGRRRAPAPAGGLPRRGSPMSSPSEARARDRVRAIGGAELVERLEHLDRVRLGRPASPPPPLAPSPGERADFDVVFAGGGLSLLHAIGLARRGLTVAVADRARVASGHRAWNASRPELEALVRANVVTAAQLDEELILTRYRHGVCRWHGGGEHVVRGVLDCALDADRLLVRTREAAEQAGVTLLDRTAVEGMAAGRDGVALSMREGGAGWWAGSSARRARGRRRAWRRQPVRERRSRVPHRRRSPDGAREGRAARPGAGRRRHPRHHGGDRRRPPAPVGGLPRPPGRDHRLPLLLRRGEGGGVAPGALRAVLRSPPDLQGGATRRWSCRPSA
jgi:hypothetical protein